MLIDFCHLQCMRQKAKLEKAHRFSIHSPAGSDVKHDARSTATQHRYCTGRTRERARVPTDHGWIRSILCTACISSVAGIRTCPGTSASGRSDSRCSDSVECQPPHSTSERCHRDATTSACGGGQYIHLQEAVIATDAPLTEAGLALSFGYSVLLQIIHACHERSEVTRVLPTGVWRLPAAAQSHAESFH